MPRLDEKNDDLKSKLESVWIKHAHIFTCVISFDSVKKEQPA